MHRDFGTPGLRYAGTSGHWPLRFAGGSTIRRDFEALASTVCSKLHSPPGLRCAGTSGHWPLRFAASSTVRRDFGAPGLRYTGLYGCACRETHLRRRQPRFHGRVPQSWRPSLESPPPRVRPRGALDPWIRQEPPSRHCPAHGEEASAPRRTRPGDRRIVNTSVDGSALLGTIGTSEVPRLDAFASVRLSSVAPTPR